MAQSLYAYTQSECNVWQEKCKNETKEVKIEQNEENNVLDLTKPEDLKIKPNIPNPKNYAQKQTLPEPNKAIYLPSKLYYRQHNTNKMQKAQSSEFQTDEALHNKLITACKDVEACKIACYRPSPTVPGLIRDLRSGIEIFNRSLPTSHLLLQQNTSLAFDEDETFLTDRRYDNNIKPSNYGLVKRNDYKSKKCWICKLEGCWSGKHPKSEREEHSIFFNNKLHNKAERYISEYEGEHEVKESDDDMDMQAICNELDIVIQDKYPDSELFLSNAGNITPEIGIFIDFGAAAYSTAVYQQYKAFQQVFGNTPLIISSKNKIKVRFGKVSSESIGFVNIKTLIEPIDFYVVDCDTLFLLSLKDMDDLDVTAFLTQSDLQRLHRRFGHPSVDRLHTLLKNADHNSSETKVLLDKSTAHCKYCQTHGPAPQRFKFKIKDDVNFNYAIIVDIMYLEGNTPVLHVVDEATRYQAAQFLKSITAQSVWEALRRCWIVTYVSPLDLIIHVSGTNFSAKEFQHNAIAMSI
ncbi:hypothetical protein EPUL_001220 [Erysiphe pulchra]|uniref:GAG-pre-integrase domain-containing protein n=1 Tax=Erysiphe pulchra TaxID=225359 RepID=A0A2S4Q1G5_9PEZI|nr:hypothetical protein EPUL_001220 [Erysiphe pulchra]